MAWVTLPGTGTPDCHSERYAGRSDGSGRRRHVLPREVSGSVQSIGLPHGQPGGTGLEKSAEAIVAEVTSTLRRAESSNAGSRLRDSMTGLAANSAGPYGMARSTARWRGGTDLPRSRRLYQSRHLARNGPWRLTALNRLKKPPYTASTYGGVGGRGREAPPTRSNSLCFTAEGAGLAAGCGRRFYQLRAWVIMPNHVHVLLLPKTSLWPVSAGLAANPTPPGIG